jgi:SAM-dependent methyltransferase
MLVLSAGRRPNRVLGIASRAVPERVKAWTRVHARRTWPPVGMVRFGSLRRLRPIDSEFGFSRGKPIDRYYLERFLAAYGGKEDYVLGDIRGSVLEVGEDKYTRRFGRVWEGRPEEAPPGYVTESHILHGDASNPRATIVGDLASGEGLPTEAFDCVICAQTLPYIYDVHAAIQTLHRILKPGGVALVTVNGIAPICRPEYEIWGDYWRFTTLSLRRLLEEAFPADAITVESQGNVLATAAFLYGVAAQELKPEELDLHDPNFEVSITARAVRAA